LRANNFKYSPCFELHFKSNTRFLTYTILSFHSILQDYRIVLLSICGLKEITIFIVLFKVEVEASIELVSLSYCSDLAGSDIACKKSSLLEILHCGEGGDIVQVARTSKHILVLASEIFIQQLSLLVCANTCLLLYILYY